MDPAIFVLDLQDSYIKLFLLTCRYLLKYICIIFLRYKVIKKSQNSRNQCFSHHFCLMIEGSGSVPMTNGSGSRRHKNIRIRIPNTGPGYCTCYLPGTFLLNFNALIQSRGPHPYYADPDSVRAVSYQGSGFLLRCGSRSGSVVIHANPDPKHCTRRSSCGLILLVPYYHQIFWYVWYGM
jgi:hypothetical protein